MEFDSETLVSHPAQAVLETMIDRMHDIVPFLDTVEAIEELSREDLGDGRLKIVRRWQGSESSAPPALAAAICSRASLIWASSFSFSSAALSRASSRRWCAKPLVL